MDFKLSRHVLRRNSQQSVLSFNRPHKHRTFSGGSGTPLVFYLQSEMRTSPVVNSTGDHDASPRSEKAEVKIYSVLKSPVRVFGVRSRHGAVQAIRRGGCESLLPDARARAIRTGGRPSCFRLPDETVHRDHGNSVIMKHISRHEHAAIV